MRRLALAAALAGSLSLGGCVTLDESHKYSFTGAALGAAGGAAIGAGIGDPIGGAIVGGVVGGIAGVLYGDYWKDEIDAELAN